MARFGTTSKIAPGVELTEIKITLDRYAPPVVTLTGRVATGNRRIDGASTAEIKTMALGDAGRAFIDEIKVAFGGGVKKDRDDG